MKCIKKLEFKKPTNHLGDVGTAGRIILKWILHKHNMKVDWYVSIEGVVAE